MPAALIILAAGLGTRFKGGVKQLTPVGRSGELLMEYSVYDAVKAGFDKVIFVIRPDIEEQFKELIGNRISEYVKTEYCFQTPDDLPEGFSVPEGRTKPWGTVHAALSARLFINEPFLIINSDDYYGAKSYKNIYDFITSAPPSAQCMSGFRLKNTISSCGTVTRGICTADSSGYLTSVTETYRISRMEDGIVRGFRNNIEIPIDEESIVSMNMWGCSREFLPMLEECFHSMLKGAAENGTLDTAELNLPEAFDLLIKKGAVTVKIIASNDEWYGMTHREDMPEITGAFSAMTEKGIYPSPLFSSDVRRDG